MIVTKGNYSPLGIIVSSIAVNPATNMVYTVNTASDAVNTINASSSKTSVGTISATGGILSDLTINPSNNILYVTDQGANTVYGFGGNTTSISLSGSGNEMVDQERIGKIGITLDESPRDIAVDSKTNNLYIMYENSEEVTEIDGSVDRVLGSFALSGPLVDIVVNPNTHTMYAINETALNVIDIPTNETKVLLMNGSVSALDIDPVANKIFIIGESSDFSSFLYIVDGVTNHVDASLSLDKYMFTEPESLSADPNTNSIYLIDGAGISVIDGVYMEKVDSIPVNTYPFSRIAVNPNTNLLYVANENSRSVYVIDTYSRIIIKTIEVDGYPKSIAVNPTSDTIYVANDVSGTISVIDGTNNTQIGTIRVGVNPISVAVNAETNMVYAANSDSDTISVIDGSIHEVVAGIRFDINPPNSGHIRCDKNEIPINQYQRIKIGAECVAEANSGFQFNSWIEDLGSNSTRTVSLSEVSDSQWNQFWSTLGLGPKDTSANLTVSRFGNFAANFEKLSPPLPDEYLIPLYGIIVSSIVGWSIPSIIGGIKTKRQERKLYSIHKKIDKLYDDGRLDSEDIKPLEDLLSETEDAYAKGKINNERYTNLKTEISGTL